MPDTAAIGWTCWSVEAFARAERERKLLFVWIGARWAGASLAMEADALHDPAVVALVNDAFVAVKVDSDERPDVNDRYNLGGWPTTAIVTDDGEVLAGGTFFSSGDLLALLGRSRDALAQRGDIVRAKTREAIQARRERADRSDASPADPDRSAVSWMRRQALDAFDRDFGGFGRGPAKAGLHDCQNASFELQKFPHVALLRFLLRVCQTSNDPDVADALTVSLDAMAEGALRDRDEGGFFRYAEARDWTAPCRDKTLEDNAALLGLYADAAQAFGRRDYVDVVRDTIRFVRQQIGESNAFATDSTAGAIRAWLAAAQLLGETPDRDIALASLDRVVLNVYRPAHGVAHWFDGASGAGGFLADQVGVALASLAAHDVTGSPVFSMLAEELMRYSLRTMWDEEAGAFVDRAEADAPAACGRLREPLRPLAANGEAAGALTRLAQMTGDRELRTRANRILAWFAASYRDDGLLGAPYALAVLDCCPDPEETGGR